MLKKTRLFLIIGLWLLVCGLIFTRQVHAEEKVYFLHQDNLGSMNFVTDSQGSVTEQKAYYPFGETRSLQSTIHNQQPTERGYTGQISDQIQTGLYYFNARYYNPYISKFISPDTVNDSLNRYEYVFNNPLNFTDPQGNQAVPQVGTPISDTCIDEVSCQFSEDETRKNQMTVSDFRRLDWDSINSGIESLAIRWYQGVGEPRMDKFDYVVNESLRMGVDPIFTLVIWIHESGASNSVGVCQISGGCDYFQDFGYNWEPYMTQVDPSGRVIRDRFEKQLEMFLYLPQFYMDRLIDKGLPVDLEHYFACFHYESCQPDDITRDYMNEFLKFYQGIMGDYVPDYPLLNIPKDEIEDSTYTQNYSLPNSQGRYPLRRYNGKYIID